MPRVSPDDAEPVPLEVGPYERRDILLVLDEQDRPASRHVTRAGLDDDLARRPVRSQDDSTWTARPQVHAANACAAAPHRRPVREPDPDPVSRARGEAGAHPGPLGRSRRAPPAGRRVRTREARRAAPDAAAHGLGDEAGPNLGERRRLAVERDSVVSGPSATVVASRRARAGRPRSASIDWTIPRSKTRSAAPAGAAAGAPRAPSRAGGAALHGRIVTGRGKRTSART